MPAAVVADAAYWERARLCLSGQGRDRELRQYSFFDKDRKPKWAKQVYRVELRLRRQHDQFLCPRGNSLNYRSTTHERSTNGYIASEHSAGNALAVPSRLSAQRRRNRRVVRLLPQMAWRDPARRNLLFNAVHDFEPGAVSRWKASLDACNTMRGSVDSCYGVWTRSGSNGVWSAWPTTW